VGAKVVDAACEASVGMFVGGSVDGNEVGEVGAKVVGSKVVGGSVGAFVGGSDNGNEVGV